MLLKNYNLILSLKAIKIHINSPIFPIDNLIGQFQSVFINQIRLPLYERDIDDPDQ